MSETCNSRHFSWLMKSCFPNPNDNNSAVVSLHHHHCSVTTLSSLPDDLLLECLSRVDSSSIPSLSLVCRRWAKLLLSPVFFNFRRHHGRLQHALFAVSAADSALFAATLRFDTDSIWKVSVFLADNDAVSPPTFHGFPSHARLSAIGPRIYIIGRNATLRYDTWTGKVTGRSPMMFSRKKFAAAAVSGKIYVAGGGPKITAVEEYDPEEDKWVVVTHATRSRYGCIGASVDGVFYVIGGLKLGASGNELSRAATTGAEAHLYASSMDLFDVEAREWLRSRAVPGGGCVVAACAAGGYIYVLASHAVELSLWRFDARRKMGASGGFGEWCRISSPPLPAQIRVDSTVRFTCVGVGEKVVLVQVSGCIDDLLRRSGRFARGLKEGLVLVYDPVAGEWSRLANLPEMIRRAACVCAEC
ncbi:F-box/kelch-repeat protein At5g26960 [Ziziphus jujuba]|uniref:F-box/kelch-repeat protein At5g26960 n=1 Tax=Ziziphus jujuba TaxID=326968 RepID=A0ABM3IA73_ZIZJJ|nr:F-box/kelch-repeat protein At5g26960 [Ziziphus jujuba]